MSIPADIFAAIQALHTRYIRVIDDDALEQWPELFVPDGDYAVITRENHDRNLPAALMSCRGHGMMKDRVMGYRKINVYEPHRYTHQVSGLEITAVADNAWHCVSNFLVVRTLQSGAMALFATGVYEDEIVREDGEYRFRKRTVITASRQTQTLLVIPL